MSNYNTGNPAPSIDPRDLDDNATVFDRLLTEHVASILDRLGVARKTWWQMEQDATALVSPNVSALAGLSGVADRGFYFTGAGAMSLYTLSSLGRTLGGIASEAAGRAAIGAAASGANTDITSITGSAASLTTSRSISATGDATWTVNFNGTANVTAAITLANSGVGAGTYGSVTVNAKGLVTAATVATPVANGGTGATTATAAGTNLGTSVVGTNTDQLATSAMVQAEIANKRAWTSFATVLTANTGTFTSASATMKYMVAFGICHIQAVVTVTTKGTGGVPLLTLPFTALAPATSMPILARENLINGRTGVLSIMPSGTQGVVIGYDNTDLITNDGCIVYINGSYPIA